MGKYSEYVNTENLRKERYAKKISMADMASFINKKSESSYLNIENGNVEPRISTINKISEVLKKPAQYFFKINVQDSCTENVGHCFKK
jgi:transcriptional regulator with XRE-family HTH domain